MKTVEIDNDGVRMSASRQMLLRHASDIPDGSEECFGGDWMGHWNVARINRLLDAFKAPVVQLPIPNDAMREMARVGKPDMDRARSYARRGLRGMPPLSFVSFQAADTLQALMVDGHQRMMALHLLGSVAVPARVLPPSLAADVRLVEVSQAITFPEPQLPTRSIQVEGLAA